MFTKLFPLIFLLVSQSVFGQSTPDASALLKESDRPRGGVERGLAWEMELTTVDVTKSSVRQFVIKTKGDNALAESKAPPKFKGEILLFKDRNMWFVKPDLKKPVAISARQKLGGQAANGDIASTQYFRDYTPTFIKTEMIDNEETALLLLKAKSETSTYDSIRYWISVKQKLAVKAEFLNLQGKVFKNATFEYKNKINFDGKSFPFISQMTISSSSNPKEKSILVYKNPKAENFSDGQFNVNSLGR